MILGLERSGGLFLPMAPYGAVPCLVCFEICIISKVYMLKWPGGSSGRTPGFPRGCLEATWRSMEVFGNTLAAGWADAWLGGAHGRAGRRVRGRAGPPCRAISLAYVYMNIEYMYTYIYV